MDRLTVIKVGGKIVEKEDDLNHFLADFSQIEGYKILVHGGGSLATKVAAQLGIESRMIDGRRITDAETLKVVTMVYGGWVNKMIVARLQAYGINAIGLTGADMNVIRSVKRPVQTIDYGFAGDIEKVDARSLGMLLLQDIVPVLSPLTHDKQGNLLNTNADTIAAETAKALAQLFDVTLIYCFEKNGVLRDEADDESVISEIDHDSYINYKEQGVIQGGMIPKLDNAFRAIDAGIKRVVITKASAILDHKGTIIQNRFSEFN
jgi:acetylglutamate kinase